MKTKTDILRYLAKTDVEVARAKAALFICDIVYGSYAESKQVHGENFSPTFCHYAGAQEGTFHQIIAKKIIADVGRRMYGDYLVRHDSLEEKIAAHVSVTRELDELWKEYQSIRTASIEGVLYPFLKRFEDASVRWWHYGAIGEDHGAVIHDVLVPKFAERHRMSVAEADAVFNQLSHPSEKTILNTEREDFLHICAALAAGKDAGKEIEAYIRKYFWFKSDFYQATLITPDVVRSDAEKEIASVGVVGIARELGELAQNFKRLHDERERLLARMKLSKEDERDIRFAVRNIQWVDERKVGMMKNFYYLLMMIYDVAKRRGIPRDEMLFYTFVDLLQLFRTGTRVSAETLRERGKGCFFAYQTGTPRLDFYGNDAEELFNAAKHFKHEGDIKGQVASIGKHKVVSGTARIIHHPTKEVFNEGEILVTSMTRIEFVPLMRKAKAIITDEGGIACHAAIVSRELGLPCVIGTRNATRILKDGDMVELDMEKGIVKVVSSA